MLALELAEACDETSASPYSQFVAIVRDCVSPSEDNISPRIQSAAPSRRTTKIRIVNNLLLSFEEAHEARLGRQFATKQ